MYSVPIAVLLTLLINVKCDSVSFYGDSYVSLPLQEAKSTTSISFRFRTRRSEALLFLAAGRTDYCLVILTGGSLKVHVNLGAGETEIASPSGLRYDDLLWHHVNITRIGANFTLDVDQVHVTRVRLSGRFHELNIHYGIFVGGLGHFNDLFLGLLENFRGCLSDVLYNAMDVVAQAKDYGQLESVTWSCAPEFDSNAKTISMYGTRSLLQLATAVSRTGATLYIELRTQTPNGVIFYATGVSTSPDFVTLQIEDGQLRLLLDKGDGIVSLQHNTSVVDGEWHTVTTRFNPALLSLQVDNAAIDLKPIPGGNRYLDLTDGIFIGGLEDSRKSRAHQQGVAVANASFQGCLRDIKLDGRSIGLPDAKLTRGVQLQCVKSSPSCDSSPCVSGATCVPHGPAGFECLCLSARCMRDNGTSTVGGSQNRSIDSSAPSSVDYINISPLQVTEGGDAFLTSKNIEVRIDRKKFGIREAGVLFNIVEMPLHGTLQIDVRRRAPQVFTLLDMNTEKVHYIHDGSENIHDTIKLDMEFVTGAGYILPDYYQGRKRIILPVNISPVNDPPELRLPHGQILRLAKGTRRRLTSDFLRVEDPDSPPEDIVFSMLSYGDTDGYIENAKNPGKPVQSFSLQELDDGLVWYVHRGTSANTRLVFRLSDGVVTGTPAVIRIATYDLEVRLINNTGLVTPHLSYALIAAANLSFTTNAEDLDEEGYAQDIRYDVVRPPHFGAVQRLRPGGKWQPVSQFSQLQLNQGLIWYHHTASRPESDDFKFQVSSLGARYPPVFDFRIRFIEVKLLQLRTQKLELNGVPEGYVSDASLLYQTDPVASVPSALLYKLVKIPTYGDLRLGTTNLNIGDSFSQNDIQEGRLCYKLFQKGFSRVEDTFKFEVKTRHGATPTTSEFRITYIPDDESLVQSNIGLLRVEEGGRAVISNKVLNLRSGGITNLRYNVTHPPEHGLIHVYDVTMTDIIRENATYFTSMEIETEQVFYEHDDSESASDVIRFVSLAISPAQQFEYVGEIAVSVELRNDNPPVRAVDRILQVQLNGEMRLSSSMLCYRDADLGTPASELRYSLRGEKIGGIFRMDAPDSEVFEFTQQDVDDRALFYRHWGPSDGHVAFLVTDGQHFTTGDLHVRASPAYLRVSVNTGALVQRGQMVILTAQNLSVETNVNVNSSNEIVYQVVRGPSFGSLEIQNFTTQTFTQADLEASNIIYRHHSGTETHDKFRFRLTEVAGVSVEAEAAFQIRIFPEVYWESLEILTNGTAEVEEGGNVPIDATVLRVSHPNINPSEITFIITKQPSYGYLIMDSSKHKVQEGNTLTSFDQASINEGRLRYVQVSANQTSDVVKFEVTNGVISLGELSTSIVVVPSTLQLITDAIHVREGGAQKLTQKHLQVATPYYQDRVEEYRVVRPPSAGRLEVIAHPGIAVRKFASKQLEEGRVVYVHDGSENDRDAMWLVARAGDKISSPVLLPVKVDLVNDQSPRIVNNTGIVLWEGGVVSLTSHLRAVDDDSPSDNITFRVRTVKGGHLSKVHNLSEAIEYFTQRLVDNGRIVFVHLGGPAALWLDVNDGLHATSPFEVPVRVQRLTLSVTTEKPLRIFPFSQRPISAENLCAVTNDGDTARPITFRLRQVPRLGHVLALTPSGRDFQEAILKDGAIFTQRDVNSSRIVYRHMLPLVTANDTDTFHLEALTPHADPILDIRVTVQVSVTAHVPEGIQHYFQIQPVQTKEGGWATITMRNLNISGIERFIKMNIGSSDTPLHTYLRLIQPPTHGDLILGESSIVQKDDMLPENVISSEKLRYKHDDSDTLGDSVVFGVLLTNTAQEMPLLNLTVPIEVAPVNDQPFRLVTEHPRLRVVQGHTAPILQSDLLTVDDDTRPENIVYDIVSGPSHGALLLLNNVTGKSQAAQRFTQADIALGRLRYVHAGPVSPLSFHFRVWDGHFPPRYAVFSVEVKPAIIDFVNSSTLYIKQGSMATSLKYFHLSVGTNGDTSQIEFNVTRNPEHGHIALADETFATKSFTQNDITTGRVVYFQTDLSAPNDTFQVTAWLHGVDGASVPVDVPVVVQPLIKEIPEGAPEFTPRLGRRTVLPLHLLDASPLAEMTGANPEYQLVERPSYGRLKRLTKAQRHRRDTRDKELSRFTLTDLKNRVVFYVSKDNGGGPPAEFRDGFVYKLLAPGVQPALGRLDFKLLPTEDQHLSATAIPDYPPISSPNISADSILIAGIVLGIVVLTVIIVLVVRCHTRRKYGRQSANGKVSLALKKDSELTFKKSAAGPGSVDLMAVPPSSLHGLNDAASLRDPSPAIPHCRVTPINAEMPTPFLCPYNQGVVRDWDTESPPPSSFSNQNTNPMLRKNQYWV